MDNPEQIYKDKVWQFLDTMNVDTGYLIDNLCVPENKSKFILCIKQYMDAKYYQGWLSFNKDYSKIYKIEPIIFKNDNDEKQKPKSQG
jgi:hypothetical protein